MVIFLEQGADLRLARLMPLTVSCFSKIQTGSTFLVLAHLGRSRKRAIKWVCVCVCVCVCVLMTSQYRHCLQILTWCSKINFLHNVYFGFLKINDTALFCDLFIEQPS